MNIIVDICANTAAGYIAQGKLVEAIPNLRAAMHFGGNESARINSIFLASQFATRAEQAFAKGDLEDAARNAGLSLAANQNEAALIVLAQIYLGRDPVVIEDIARQLVEIAKDDDPRGLKINALLWRLDALQQIEPRNTEIEEQIGRDAMAAISRLIDQHPGSPHVLMARAMLYRRFGNVPAALADLRAIQVVEPANVAAAAHCADLVADARDPACAADLALVASLPDDNPPNTLTQYYDLARRSGAAGIAQGLMDRVARLDDGFAFLAKTKASLETAPPYLALGAAATHASGARVFLYAFDAQTAKTLVDVTLPMLLAPGNLPALAASRSITVDITATSESMRAMAAAPVMAKLAEFARVELRGHDAAAPRVARRAYGLAFHAAVLRARADHAALLPIPTNALIADGSIATIAELATSDRSVLFFDALEVASAPLFGWLGGGRESGDRIVMKPSDLSEAVLRHMPAANRRWIVDSDGSIESGARRLLFAKKDGLSVRSLQCTPIYIGAGALAALGDDLSDPPDGYVIDRILGADKAKVEIGGIANTKAFVIAVMADIMGSDTRVNPRSAIDVIIEQCRAAPSTLGRTQLLAMAAHWNGLPPARAEATDDADEATLTDRISQRMVAV